MADVYDSTQALRHFVNDTIDFKYRLIQDLDSWFQLCSAMDVLEDTDAAISGYLDATFDENKVGEIYLFLYGLFQAMVVQQDATASVYESLRLPFDKKQGLNPVDDIRHIRHDAFGHPTDSSRLILKPSSLLFLSPHPFR